MPSLKIQRALFMKRRPTTVIHVQIVLKKVTEQGIQSVFEHEYRF